MSNVKPGDIARVINSDNGNEGRTCYVEGPGYMDAVDGWCWWCVLLQPSKAEDGHGRLVRMEAGEHVWGRDTKLRRIDPPADETSDTVVREWEVET